jgi:hypothetical protein
MPGTAVGTWHGGNRAGGIVGGACWTVPARLPLWVLIGAFLGILAGITFGERTAVLRPLGDVYAIMLLSVVYPYILNTWLSFQAANGFRAAQLAYWIDGKPRPDPTPRWNLLDNVLRPTWRGL